MTMESGNTLIEGAVQLLSETQQKYKQGQLELTVEDWAELHFNLDYGRPLLEDEEVGEEQLEQVALLIIRVFGGHEVLSRHFAPLLDRLRSEPYELGVPLRFAKVRRVIRVNKTTMLSFIKFAEEQAQGNATGQQPPQAESNATKGPGNEQSN